MPLDQHPSARPTLLRIGGGRALLSALLLLLTMTTSLPAYAEGLHDRVERLHREGRSARDRGDRKLALELLSQAWKLRKTHDGGASLAQVEFELGMMREAATHLAYACEHLPASAEPARVARLLEVLAKIKRQLVTLSISIHPKTARVSLNGKSLGLALELPKEVFADPGHLSLSAELEGYSRWTTQLQKQAGDHETLRVQLEPVERAPVEPHPTRPRAERAPVPLAPEPRDDDFSVPLLLSAGLSGAALASSAALWLAADTKEQEAERRLMRLHGTHRCGFGTPFVKECKQVRGSLESERTLRAISYGAMATSAVGVAISYLVWRHSEAEQPSLRAAVEPSAFWLGMQRRF